jgi:crossover junction endodeoxyribonuclease RuvC
MSVMGVDLSLTATGLVVLGADGAILLAEVFKPKSRGDDRLWDIACWVAEAVRLWEPSAYCIEAMAYGSPFNVVVLAEMHGAVRCERARRSLPQPYYVSPATLKKYATGIGKGEKGVVQMCVLEKWGHKFVDNNLADAYVLARIAGGLDGSIPATLKYEQDCIKAIKDGALNKEIPNAKHF